MSNPGSAAGEPTRTKDEELESVRAHLQALLADRESQKQEAMQMYRDVIASGQIAMKSALLINGGAAVALLAFIGHLVSVAEQRRVLAFAMPLGLFVAGVGAAAMATGFTYVTLSSYRIKKIKLGNRANFLAVTLVGLSYLAFILGAWLAYEGFESMVP